MIKVLITSQGGAGSLSLINDLSIRFRKKIIFYGTHYDETILRRSSRISKKNFIVSKVDDEKKYLSQNIKIVKNNKINFIIPNSDKEVYFFSKYRKYFKNKLFLPAHKDIIDCQDKKKFFHFSGEHNLNVPFSVDLKGNSSINYFFKNKKTKLSYVRITEPRSAGAYGAAIIKNKNELRQWLKIWHTFKKIKQSFFTISEFLNGRIFDTCLIFANGKPIISKVIEKKSYVLSNNALTGAGSTPETTSTVSNKRSKIISEYNLKVIKKLNFKNSSLSNGIYHSTVRYDYKGRPCMTEINIGRFPMINTIFNNFGKFKLIDVFFETLLNKKKEPKFKIDNQSFGKIYTLRSLDHKPFFYKEKK